MSRQLAVRLGAGFVALLGIATFAGLPVFGRGWVSAHDREVWGFVSRLLEWDHRRSSYALMVLPFAIIAACHMVGSFFGFSAEVLLAATGGTVVGALLSFMLARYSLSRPLERLVSKRIPVNRFDRKIAARGLRSVLLIRLSPVLEVSLEAEPEKVGTGFLV